MKKGYIILLLLFIPLSFALPTINTVQPINYYTYYNITGSGGGNLSGSGTSGQMCYFTDTSTVNGIPNLRWDETNKILTLQGNSGYEAQFYNNKHIYNSASGEDSFGIFASDGNGGYSYGNRGTDYKFVICATSGGTLTNCAFLLDSNGNLTILGNLSATKFYGDGSGLTGLPSGTGEFVFINNSLYIYPNTNYPKVLNMSTGNLTGIKHITGYIPTGQDGWKVYGRGSGGFITNSILGVYDSTNNQKIMSMDGSYDVSNGITGAFYIIAYKGSLGSFAGRPLGDFGMADGNYTLSSDKRMAIVQAIQMNASDGIIWRYNLRSSASAFKVPLELFSDGRVYLANGAGGSSNLEKQRVIVGGSMTRYDDNRSTLQVIGNGNITTNLSVGTYIRNVPTLEMVCNNNTEGAIYYNSSQRRHYGCNSTTWSALY